MIAARAGRMRTDKGCMFINRHTEPCREVKGLGNHFGLHRGSLISNLKCSIIKRRFKYLLHCVLNALGRPLIFFHKVIRQMETFTEKL